MFNDPMLAYLLPPGWAAEEIPYPLSPRAREIITSTYKGAMSDDAVRECEIDPRTGKVRTRPYCYPRTECEYTLARCHGDDHDLACAWASVHYEWPDTQGMTAEQLIAQAESWAENNDFGCP